MKRIVIMGGGISGLTTAYFLAKKGHDVHVVEKNAELGGLLRSFDYGDAGHFDYGAHNILETGIKELDDFYYTLFSEGEWQVTKTLKGQTRALTGLIYQNKLQENSPFIDLRHHPDKSRYIADFFLNLEVNACPFENVYDHSADEYARYLFGPLLTEDIISPALEQLYGKPAKDMNAMVLFLTQFTRIGLFEENIMAELVNTRLIGGRLSYTEQLNLPDAYCGSLKSLYPKKYGIYRVIDAIKVKLDGLGVTFHMEKMVKGIEIDAGKITSLTIGEHKITTDMLIATSGLASLVGLLALDTNGMAYDAPPKTVMTHLLIDKPLQCGEVSFIYRYDKGSRIFRVDNYQKYCDGAERKGGIPITIESLVLDDVSDADLQTALIDELKKTNLITSDTKINFIKTERLVSGFPMLSNNNIRIMDSLRAQIDRLGIENLVTMGVLSEKGQFFENQVIQDAYKKIKEIA